MIRLLVIGGLVALAAVFIGCGGDNDKKCKDLYYTDREISDSEGFWWLENCTMRNGVPVAK